MGEQAVSVYAGNLEVGDVVTQNRWRIASLWERNGVISATGHNSAGTQFALCTKPTKQVLRWT